MRFIAVLLLCVLVLCCACDCFAEPSRFLFSKTASRDIRSMLASSGSVDPSTVTIDTGVVKGEIGDGWRAWRGIPFAEPITARNRFAPPKPRSAWDGIFDATRWGNACPQPVCDMPTGLCPDRISEDCLNLNVFAPLNSTAGVLHPVLFWIHGGRYTHGAGGVTLYDGREYAKKGVVVVSINYRLGVYGFLVNKKLGVAGNNAILDQRLAMEWVQRNIKAFGGDPWRVTIAGESAGAVSVSVHLTSVQSTGLYSQAIMQSTPFALPLRSIDSLDSLGQDFMKSVKCDSIDCLASKPWEDIILAQEAAAAKFQILHPMVAMFPWTPVIDGVNIREQPIEAIRNGRHYAVPLLIGSNAEEAIMFVYDAWDKNMSTMVYDGALAIFFFPRFLTVHGKYPPGKVDGDKRPLLSKVFTDYLFTATARNVSVSFAKKAPVYLYQFDHVLSFDPWGVDYSMCIGHACHGVELPFIFANIELDGFQPTKEEQRLQRELLTFWSNFVKSANPSSDGQGKTDMEWPAFNGGNLLSMQFSTAKTTVVNQFDKAICDFWDNLGYTFGHDLFRSQKIDPDRERLIVQNEPEMRVKH